MEKTGKSKETNKLKEMFTKQAEFQTRLGNSANLYSTPFIKDMILALTCEAMEALQEVPWKEWKKNQKFDTDKFKAEIIDIWHFLINLSMAAGLDEKSLYDEFMKKNRKNFQRQKEGY